MNSNINDYHFLYDFLSEFTETVHIAWVTLARANDLALLSVATAQSVLGDSNADAICVPGRFQNVLHFVCADQLNVMGWTISASTTPKGMNPNCK
ncbi:hypothetical protein niasHT_034020 [Heterodera trifolii]|uniref:Uncharacterized protein n=1 Tax=Heterodera trifolii TaxID=157864 RepID=A0ABD2I435_9BILA